MPSHNLLAGLQQGPKKRPPVPTAGTGPEDEAALKAAIAQAIQQKGPQLQAKGIDVNQLLDQVNSQAKAIDADLRSKGQGPDQQQQALQPQAQEPQLIRPEANILPSSGPKDNFLTHMFGKGDKPEEPKPVNVISPEELVKRDRAEQGAQTPGQALSDILDKDLQGGQPQQPARKRDQQTPGQALSDILDKDLQDDQSQEEGTQEASTPRDSGTIRAKIIERLSELNTSGKSGLEGRYPEEMKAIKSGTADEVGAATGKMLRKMTFQTIDPSSLLPEFVQKAGGAVMGLVSPITRSGPEGAAVHKLVLELEASEEAANADIPKNRPPVGTPGEIQRPSPDEVPPIPEQEIKEVADDLAQGVGSVDEAKAKLEAQFQGDPEMESYFRDAVAAVEARLSKLQEGPSVAEYIFQVLAVLAGAALGADPFKIAEVVGGRGRKENERDQLQDQILELQMGRLKEGARGRERAQDRQLKREEIGASTASDFASLASRSQESSLNRDLKKRDIKIRALGQAGGQEAGIVGGLNAQAGEASEERMLQIRKRLAQELQGLDFDPQLIKLLAEQQAQQEDDEALGNRKLRKMLGRP